MKTPEKNIRFEAGSMIIYHPRFLDAAKTRLKALVRLPTGQIVEMEADCVDHKSTLIRDIFAQYTREEIEAYTLRESIIVEKKSTMDTQIIEDKARDEEREITFQSKTKALEVPEVMNCKDPRVARKIRRAKSPFEVAGWLAVAFMMSLDEETGAKTAATGAEMTPDEHELS